MDEKHLANVCSSPGPGPGPQAPRCLQTLTKTSQTLSPKLEHLNLAKNTCARSTRNARPSGYQGLVRRSARVCAGFINKCTRKLRVNYGVNDAGPLLT